MPSLKFKNPETGEWEELTVGVIVAPEVTTEDNGKFLRVVNGTWSAATVRNAEEVSF